MASTSSGNRASIACFIFAALTRGCMFCRSSRCLPFTSGSFWPAARYTVTLGSCRRSNADTQPTRHGRVAWRNLTQVELPSAVVVLMLIPRREQDDVKVSDGKQHNAATMTEWDEQLPKFPVFL